MSRGYAYLMVDVRHTGTSTASWSASARASSRTTLGTTLDLRTALMQRKSRGARSFLRCAGRTQFGALQPAGLQAIFASERGEDAVGEVGLAGGFPSPYIAILLGTETA